MARHPIVQHTLKEVSRNLGRSMKHIRILVRTGWIRSIVVGGKPRVTWDAIFDFLEGENPLLKQNQN